MSYRVHWDIQGAICRYGERCSINDVVAALGQIYQLDAFQVFIFILHDFSAVRVIEDGVAATATLASRGLNPGLPNHKLRTAIVTQDETLRATLRSIKAGSHIDFEVFDDSSEAETWARRDITQY